MPPQSVRDLRSLSADTRRLIAGVEGREVDFKRTASTISAEDLVAFANSSGGVLLAGVDEVEGQDGRTVGQIVGADITDSVRQTVVQRAASCRPQVEVRIRAENTSTAKPILRIDIAKGDDRPYCTSSGTYKFRADGQNVALDPPMLKVVILDAESEEFIARFRAASDRMVRVMELIHESLQDEIANVGLAAQMAQSAAEDALSVLESLDQ